jgi:hypothetical protein
MLRIFLFGLSNRRKQPERYVQCALKFYMNILKKLLKYFRKHCILIYEEYMFFKIEWKRRFMEMKNKCFFGFGVLFVFWFLLTGCPTDGSDEPYTGPKTIKITGYSSQGITANDMEIYLESTGIVHPPTAEAEGEINGQIITYSLTNWKPGGNTTGEPWAGMGKSFIVIACDPPKDTSKDGAKYVYSEDGKNATPVDIKDAVTTLEWSKFIWLMDVNWG